MSGIRGRGTTNALIHAYKKKKKKKQTNKHSNNKERKRKPEYNVHLHRARYPRNKKILEILHTIEDRVPFVPRFQEL